MPGGGIPSFGRQSGTLPGGSRGSNLGRYKHDTEFCIGEEVLIDNDA